VEVSKSRGGGGEGPWKTRRSEVARRVLSMDNDRTKRRRESSDSKEAHLVEFLFREKR